MDIVAHEKFYLLPTTAGIRTLRFKIGARELHEVLGLRVGGKSSHMNNLIASHAVVAGRDCQPKAESRIFEQCLANCGFCETAVDSPND